MKENSLLLSKNISFHGRPNYKKDLPKIKNAIKRTFPIIESPSKFTPKTKVEHFIFEDISDKLRELRSILDSRFQKRDVNGYFHSLIELTKSYRVANCGEIAEITKTVLKMNGIKNCDIFLLFAQKADGSQPPRFLDHVITAININKHKKNKKLLKLFEPSPKTKVIDLWANKNIETIKGLKKEANTLNFLSDEKILLMPIKVLEPDKKTLEELKKIFPTLVIKK